MIIYDPTLSADKNRGIKEQRFIEAIDLLPTFRCCRKQSKQTPS